MTCGGGEAPGTIGQLSTVISFPSLSSPVRALCLQANRSMTVASPTTFKNLYLFSVWSLGRSGLKYLLSGFARKFLLSPALDQTSLRTIKEVNYFSSQALLQLSVSTNLMK